MTHLAELYLKDVTITGHNRSIFAQYSVSDMAMGSFLENVKNRLSKYDTFLNTIFRLEFPRQDLCLFWKSFSETPSNTCSVS